MNPVSSAGAHMINRQIISPESIVVVGGSNTLTKPGGKIVRNLLDGAYAGRLCVVNPKERSVQGVRTFNRLEDVEEAELAIIAIAAPRCLDAIEFLIEHLGTRAFILISAGFGEVSEAGREAELKIRDAVEKVAGCLIGPNCIGVLNRHYSGVFTTPIPKLEPDGCDLVSSSGATAVFIMEAGMQLGLKFCNVFSVGNAVQTSVEDVLEYLDESWVEGESSDIKLLYIESISQPRKFLRHTASLVRKGCRIAAIKAGATEAGSRAASSHTGALASSDLAVRALFRKAGIVYCSSREELITVASIFNYRKLRGRNIAVITHAGGSAVMLSDALARGGLEIPVIEGPDAEELLGHLDPGSSVSNPIDFLATGSAEQLGLIIDYCEHRFDFIDAMIVVFGSPGLFDVENVYNVLSQKLDECSKPILPVLPSVINAEREIAVFLSRGHVNFPDEVVLGTALAEVCNTPPPMTDESARVAIDEAAVRAVVDGAAQDYLEPAQIRPLLAAAGIDQVAEIEARSRGEALAAARRLAYPLAMKVVGPVHKSDVGGVSLDIVSDELLLAHFDHLMAIEGARAVLLQPMVAGIELFVGAIRDRKFGHGVFVGLGGIFVEVLKDVQTGLVPLSRREVIYMLRKLQGYPLLRGVRGREGVDEEQFVEIVLRVSALLQTAPEIVEMDLNPLMGGRGHITAVDARVRISASGGQG
jgi:acetyltransferase